MLNVQKKKKKEKEQQQNKLPKIQNFKFHYCLINFGRDLPQEYAWFLGVN